MARCEARWNGVQCGAVGTQRHHIIPKSEFGPGTPDNLMLVCKGCHHAIHIAPEVAIQDGNLKRGRVYGFGVAATKNEEQREAD